MKKLLMSAVCGTMLLTSGAAQANCGVFGYAVRVNQFIGQGQLFLTNGLFTNSDSLLFCNNFEPSLDAVIAAAVTSKSIVIVVGDAPSCPVSGPSRFIGNCLAVVVAP